MQSNPPPDVKTRVDQQYNAAGNARDVVSAAREAEGAVMTRPDAENTAGDAPQSQGNARDVMKKVAAVGAISAASAGAGGAVGGVGGLGVGYALGAAPAPETQAVEEGQSPDSETETEDAAAEVDPSAQQPFQDAESIESAGDAAAEVDPSAQQPFQDAELLGFAEGNDAWVGDGSEGIVDGAEAAGGIFVTPEQLQEFGRAAYEHGLAAGQQAAEEATEEAASVSGGGGAAVGFDPSHAPHATSVTDDMSFGEAFAAARSEIGGGGGVFTWHGNSYHTYTREEWGGISGSEKEPEINGGHEGAEAVVNDASEGVIDDESNEAWVGNGSEGVIDGESHEALEGLLQNLIGDDDQGVDIADYDSSVEPAAGDFNSQAVISDW